MRMESESNEEARRSVSEKISNNVHRSAKYTDKCMQLKFNMESALKDYFLLT